MWVCIVRFRGTFHVVMARNCCKSSRTVKEIMFASKMLDFEITIMLQKVHGQIKFSWILVQLLCMIHAVILVVSLWAPLRNPYYTGHSIS